MRYSDDFLTRSLSDVNGDGWVDIINIGYPGKESYWYENPGNKDGPWARHLIIDSTDDESPVVGDLFGDGKAELMCCMSNYLGYAAPDQSNPTASWKFHRVSPMHKDYQQVCLHGLGFGDVNGDGRNDILVKDGW